MTVKTSRVINYNPFDFQISKTNGEPNLFILIPLFNFLYQAQGFRNYILIFIHSIKEVVKHVLGFFSIKSLYVLLLLIRIRLHSNWTLSLLLKYTIIMHIRLKK